MLVLASRSPRRKQLLTNAGFEFVVRPADVDETTKPHENPEDFIQRLAQEKAAAVECAPGEIVLGADTAVVMKSEIFGKPRDAQEAVRMLTALQGRKHEVLTGVCLRSRHKTCHDYASTEVWFLPMNEADIQDYVRTGEPLDKAGAYAIQGLASKFIERIHGPYSNVVGLPVSLVWRMLRSFDKED